MIDCKHLADGKCGLGLYGGRPSPVSCQSCRFRSPVKPAQGLGDTVDRVLTRTGIGPVYKQVVRRVAGRDCGCQKRQQALNKLVPYGTNQNPPDHQQEQR